MFLKNAENVGLADIALAALWVAGSGPYSPANCSWYLFWYTKSRNFLIAAWWPPLLKATMSSCTPRVEASGPLLPGKLAGGESDGVSTPACVMIGVRGGRCRAH